jgi:hypothetical protein
LKDKRHDKSASVCLRNGTTRVGRWKDGSPVGDWWKDHILMEDTNLRRVRSILQVTTRGSSTTLVAGTGATPVRVSPSSTVKKP